MSRIVCCHSMAQVNELGVWLLELYNDTPYALWRCDLYACPECSHEFLADLGANPYCSVYHDGSIALESQLDAIRSRHEAIHEWRKNDY